VRAVLDPNVLVSALISPAGPPREIVGAWMQGRFDLVASPALLGELRDVLERPEVPSLAHTRVSGGLAGLAM